MGLLFKFGLFHTFCAEFLILSRGADWNAGLLHAGLTDHQTNAMPQSQLATQQTLGQLGFSPLPEAFLPAVFGVADSFSM